MSNVDKVFEKFADELGLPNADVKQALAKSELVSGWIKRKVKVTGTFLGGPYRRGTDMPLDSLTLHLVLSPKYYYDYKENSAKLLTFLKSKVSEEYGNTLIGDGGLVVRIKDNAAVDLDLVPSIRLRKGGFLVPNGCGNWLKTNPNREEVVFKTKDENSAGRYKKLTKIIKAWNLKAGKVFCPYYLELLVYYRVSDFSKSYSELMHSIFASKCLFLPEYLNCPAVGEGISSGVLTGLGQKIAEEAYSISSEAIGQTDPKKAIQIWRTLLGSKLGKVKKLRV